MQVAWEMTKKANESISKKLRDYHGDPKETVHTSTQMSYEDAKNAGNVRAMISCKRGTHKKGVEKIVALSNEVYTTKSITDIQNGIKSLEASVENTMKTVQLMEQEQERKIINQYRKIGGLSGIHLDAAVNDFMESWRRTDEKYLEENAKLRSVKREYTAYCNAREMYLEDNKDLIEAEREKARQRELLSSGILEELGITQSEATQNADL